MKNKRKYTVQVNLTTNPNWSNVVAIAEELWKCRLFENLTHFNISVFVKFYYPQQTNKSIKWMIHTNIQFQIRQVIDVVLVFSSNRDNDKYENNMNNGL